MKAIVRAGYGRPDVLRFEEVTTPRPAAGEVLVRVRATSINTADLDLLAGRPFIARVGTGLIRPRHAVPGLDVAGIVEVVGDGVTRLRPGDEVWADMFSYGHAAFAEYACAPERAFEPKPAGVSFEEAATVPHSGVLALQAIRSKGRVEPGHRVLVNGGGGCVGPFAIQIATAAGAEVTAVDHRDKLELMRSAGADHLVDYTAEDVTRSDRRFDLIVDIAATRPVLSFKRILRPHGRYVQISRDLRGFIQAALLGSVFGGDKQMGVFTWKPNKADDLAHLGRLLEAGRISPVVDRTCGLADVPEAMSRLSRGESKGKLVVAP